MPNLYWYDLNTNFGDMINPFLAARMTTKPVRFTAAAAQTDKVCAIGSILQIRDLRHHAVWGSGIIGDDFLCNPPDRIHAVRGPLTRKRLLDLGIDCPETYGDPALLLPLFHRPVRFPVYDLGIVPHYVDQQDPLLQALVREGSQLRVRGIDVLDHVPSVIDAIRSCRAIASSSLHGLIVADAYRIPSLWVEFSDKVMGGGFKFKDYYASIGIEDCRPVRINRGTTATFLLEAARRHPPTVDLAGLLSACPFYVANRNGGTGESHG